MSIYCDVYPSEGAPNKYQIERIMIVLDQLELLTPDITDRFKLKKYEDPRIHLTINIPLERARKELNTLYPLLPKKAKLMFQCTELSGALQYIAKIFDNIEDAGCPEINDRVKIIMEDLWKLVGSIILNLDNEGIPTKRPKKKKTHL